MSAYARFLDDYNSYHLNPKNKATHYLGVPLIVLAVIALLRAVPLFTTGQVGVDLAMLIMVPVLLFYFSLNLMAGGAMTLVFIGFYFLGGRIGMIPAWSMFIFGWIVQFIGHHFEGRKPAFLRNGIHLLIGPMWILNDMLLKLHLPAYNPKKA